MWAFPHLPRDTQESRLAKFCTRLAKGSERNVWCVWRGMTYKRVQYCIHSVLGVQRVTYQEVKGLKTSISSLLSLFPSLLLFHLNSFMLTLRHPNSLKPLFLRSLLVYTAPPQHCQHTSKCNDSANNDLNA